jgi:hypothetical protein
MKSLTVDECEICSRLYFPGDEVFPTSNKGYICDECDRTSTRFAGLVLS